MNDANLDWQIQIIRNTARIMAHSNINNIKESLIEQGFKVLEMF